MEQTVEIDDMGNFEQRWECEAPPVGSTFRTLEDEWDYDGEKPVRTIKRIERLAS